MGLHVLTTSGQTIQQVRVTCVFKNMRRHTFAPKYIEKIRRVQIVFIVYILHKTCIFSFHVRSFHCIILSVQQCIIKTQGAPSPGQCSKKHNLLTCWLKALDCASVAKILCTNKPEVWSKIQLRALRDDSMTTGRNVSSYWTFLLILLLAYPGLVMGQDS